MSRFLNILHLSRYSGNCLVSSRSLTCSPVSCMKNWRISKGLSANRNGEGILRDGPDYSFLDGRPTPLLVKQKKRMLKQQEYADKIVNLNSELEFAKKRHQEIVQAKEQERENIVNNWLKPKGKALLRKK